MGWKRERKHPAERAKDLAGELRVLRDQSDGFRVIEELREKVAITVQPMAGQEFLDPEFAGGDFRSYLGFRSYLSFRSYLGFGLGVGGTL